MYKVYIGIDQSNTETAIGVVVFHEKGLMADFRTETIKNPFKIKDRKKTISKMIYRNMVRVHLENLLDEYSGDYVHVAYEALSIQGNKTTYKYMTEAGAMMGIVQNAILCSRSDMITRMHEIDFKNSDPNDYGIYHTHITAVPVPVWKQGVLGVNRSIQNEEGIKPSKYDTYKYLQRMGLVWACMEIIKGESIYNDNMGDALCIALYAKKIDGCVHESMRVL